MWTNQFTWDYWLYTELQWLEMETHNLLLRKASFKVYMKNTFFGNIIAIYLQLWLIGIMGLTKFNALKK